MKTDNLSPEKRAIVARHPSLSQFAANSTLAALRDMAKAIDDAVATAKRPAEKSTAQVLGEAALVLASVKPIRDEAIAKAEQARAAQQDELDHQMGTGRYAANAPSGVVVNGSIQLFGVKGSR